MATLNEISVGEALQTGIVVRVGLDDQVTEPVARAERAFNTASSSMISSASLAVNAFRQLDTQVQAAGRSIESVMNATSGTSGAITQAATRWDQLAGRMDASTKAGNQLESAMRRIDSAQTSLNATLKTTDLTSAETARINDQATAVFRALNEQLALAAERYVKLQVAQRAAGSAANYTTPLPATVTPEQIARDPSLKSSYYDPRALALFGVQEAARRNLAAQQEAAALLANTQTSGTAVAGFLGGGSGFGGGPPPPLPPMGFYSGSGRFPNQQTANVPAYNQRVDDLQVAFAAAQKLAQAYDADAAAAARLKSEVSNIVSVYSLLGDEKTGRALNVAFDDYAVSVQKAQKALEAAEASQARFLAQSRQAGSVAAEVSAHVDQRLGGPATAPSLSLEEQSQVNDLVSRFTEKQNQINQAGLSPGIANLAQSENLKQFQVQLDGVTQAIERTRAATSAMLDGLAEKFIPGITAAKQFAAVQQQIQELFDAGRVTQQEAADITTVQAGAYDKLAESARVAAQATAQQAENARLGGIAGTRPELLPAQSATRQADVEAAFGAQQQQIDQINVLATAEQKYADQHKTLQSLRTQGVVGAQEAAVAEARYAAEVEGVRKKVEDQAKAYQALQTAENQANTIRATGRQLTAAESAELEKAQKTFQASVVEIDKTKGATLGATVAVGGMTREFVVLAHEISQGNISRLGGSVVVLTEYFQTFRAELFKVVGQVFTTAAGLSSLAGLAVVGVLTAMAVAAQHLASQLVDLGTQARATRSDFSQAASDIQAANRELLNGPNALSVAEKNASIQPNAGSSITTNRRLNVSSAELIPALATIRNTPEFSDNVQGLEELGRLANDLAAVYQITLPEAAKKLSAAMRDPAAAATELAKQGFPGVNDALARQIEFMQKAGNQSEAYTTLLEHMQPQLRGAAEAHTPLGEALARLGRAFDDAGSKGRGFGEGLGKFLVDVITAATNKLAGFVEYLNELDKKNAAPGGITPAGRGVLEGQFIPGSEAAGFVPQSAVLRSQAEVFRQQFSSLFTPKQPDQQVLVSTSGQPGQSPDTLGRGVGQVTPQTASAFGVNTAFIDENRGQNLLVAMARLLQESQKPGANELSIVKGYGGFGDSPQSQLALANRAAAVASADISAIPADEVGFIKAVLAAWGKPELAGLMLRLIPGESGNRQFIGDLSGTGVTGQRQGIFGDAGRVGGGGPTNDAQRQYDALVNRTGQFAGSPTEKQNLLAAQINDLEAGKAAVEKYSLEWVTLDERQKTAQKDLLATLTPFQALERAAQEQADVDIAGYAAATAYAEARKKANEAARQEGSDTASADQVARQYTLTQEHLTAGFEKKVAQIQVDTAAQAKQTNATFAAVEASESYAIAVQHQADLVKATKETDEFSIRNTAERAAQIQKLTAAYDAQAASEKAASLNPAIAQQEEQIRLTRAEISVVGESAEEQAKYVAVYKARQELVHLGIAEDTQQGQVWIANAAAQAALTEKLNFYKQSLSDVAGALTGAFDQLGQAIANAFVSGQGAAVNFHNAVKSILGSLATKAIELGVINPITNALGLGPTKGTLYGALEAGSQPNQQLRVPDPATIAAIRSASGADQNQISLQDNTAALITLTDAINAGGIGGRNGGTDLLNPDGSLVVPPRPPQAPPGLQESQILSPIEQDAYRVQGHYGSFLPVGSPEEEATQRQLGIRASDTARFLQIDPGNQQSDAWKYPWPDSPQSRRIENPDFVQTQAEADANIISAAIAERLKEVPLDQLHTGQAYLDRYGTPTPPDVMALPPSEIDRNGLVNGSSASGATMPPTGPTNIDRNGLTQAVDEQKQNLEDNTDALQKLNSTLNAASESNVSAPGISPGAVGSIFSGGGGAGVSGTSAISLSQQLNGGSTGNLVFVPGQEGFVDQGNFDTSGSGSKVIFLNGTNAGPQSVVDTNTGIQTEPLAAPGQGDFGTVTVNASSPSSSPIIIPSQGGSGGFTDIAQTIGAVSNVERSVAGGSGFSTNNFLNIAGLADKLSSSNGGGLFQNLFGGVKSFLNTNLSDVFPGLAGGAAETIDAASAAELAATSPDLLLSPELGAAGGFVTPPIPPITGSATIGGVLGGVGGGFALGSVLGNSVQNLLGKTGPAPTIGAGVGALSGAVIGSIFPVVGTLIGGLIGGALGGAGGGLIGPKPASPFSSTYVGVGDNGLLSLGGSVSQQLNTDADRAAANVAIQQTNAVLRNNGLGITGIEGVNGAGRALNVNQGDIASFQIGQNSPKGPIDPSKFADFAAAFSAFRFAPTTPGVSSAFFQNKSFASAEELDKVTQSVNTFVAALQSSDAAGRISDFLAKTSQMANADIPQRLSDITTFVTQTVPQLTNTGSLAQQIQQLNTQYRAAITMAQQLGYAEQQLTDSRDAAIAKANANAAFTLQQGEVGNRLSFSTAYDAVNAPQGAANAPNVLRAQQATQLYGFDYITAAQARKQLSDSLIATYGDAFKNSAAFANQMAILEQSLGEQRLAIVRNFSDQIENADKANVTAAFNFQQGDVGLNVRYQTATDTLHAGDPGSVGQINAQKATALANFDLATAPTQRKQLSDQLISFYGDAITANAGYAAQLALLEKTLGVERLAIAKQFDDQIANENKQAQGSVYSLSQSLASYARNLGNSVLSPQQQYANAQKAFEQQSSLAQGGDFTAIQNLTGYADTFISTSRALFGSGQQYFQNVTAVLDVLNNLATTPSTTLTSYAFQQIQKQLMLDQTDQLLTGLGQLGDILNSILNQMQVSPLKPSRLA